jgi:pyridoxine 4-dehydrogenase
MRITGPTVFGPPASRADAIALLRAAVDGGVDHIDTAQYYGPNIANELICEALHPYSPELTLVSKVGARRDGRGGILGADEPAQLRRGIEDNLRTLRVDARRRQPPADARERAGCVLRRPTRGDDLGA